MAPSKIRTRSREQAQILRSTARESSRHLADAVRPDYTRRARKREPAIRLSVVEHAQTPQAPRSSTDPRAREPPSSTLRCVPDPVRDRRRRRERLRRRLCRRSALAGDHELGIELARAGDVLRDRRSSRRARRAAPRASRFARCRCSDASRANEQRRIAQARRVDRDAAAVDAERPGRRIVVRDARAELENALLRRIVGARDTSPDRRRSPCTAREYRRACPSSCCAARVGSSPARRSSLRRRFVVRQMRAALQRAIRPGRSCAESSARPRRETARPKCDAAITAISRASNPKRSTDARLDRRGGDERLRASNANRRARRRRRRRTARARARRRRTRRRDAATRRDRRA